MNKKHKKMSKKAKANEVLHSRKGVILLALIALMVLIINLISASYSWFQPSTVTKKSVGYSYDGKLRSQDCDMTTILGTKAAEADPDGGIYKGQIDYNPNLSSNQHATNTISIAAGATQYFKTEIVNRNTENATDISLYIKVMPACTVAVTYPSNSVRTVSDSRNDYYLIRNAYIKKYVPTDVNGPGLLEVEWFVKNTGSSGISINLDYLYIIYS